MTKNEINSLLHVSGFDPEKPLWQMSIFEFAELILSLQPKPTLPEPEQEYLNTNEASEYLKVSRSTLLRWKDDYLPCIKKGGVLRFRKSDLDNALKK